MPIVPDNIVAGVLVTQATMQKWTDSIKELQAAGPLFTSTNATTSTTAGPVTITNWDGNSVTLTASRLIQIVTSGILTGTVVGVIGTVACTLGSLQLKVQVECAQTSGGIDINQGSLIVALAAGTYTLSATLTRNVTAGTIAFAGSANIVQIVDWGPA